MISRKPNLFCLGAQKAGTSTLADLLRGSPDIYVPPDKEVHFFERPTEFRRGVEWYESNYAEVPSGVRYLADLTPDYLVYSYVADRLLRYTKGNAKLLVALRHPVDRAYSQFNFHRRHGLEPEADFSSAVTQAPPEREVTEFIEWHNPAHYLSRGLYYPQVKRYIDRFGRSAVHVVLFTDLVKDQQDVVAGICRFLSLESYPVGGRPLRANRTTLPHSAALLRRISESRIRKSVKRILNREVYDLLRSRALALLTKPPPRLDRAVRNELFQRYFAEDVLRLEELIEIDLSDWREG
jgi:hypothetical protein